MRHPQYTLTPAHVQAHATVLLQKYLCLKDHGPKCRADTLWTVLCYAASRIISLAAACASLRDAPSDSAAHDALLATLPNSAELQRRLNRALQGDLPHALRRRRQPLAIDLTLIPYHGQPVPTENAILTAARSIVDRKSGNLALKSFERRTSKTGFTNTTIANPSLLRVVERVFFIQGRTGCALPGMPASNQPPLF